MGALLDIIMEDSRWSDFGLAKVAEDAGQRTLSHFGMTASAFEISLLGCDDARISVLNAEFREKPQPTNVLSWPSEERAAEVVGEDPALPVPGTVNEPTFLGDIAIAWETCEREAREQGKSMDAHVTHLIVHAVLHLLGYDHIDDEDAALMESHEVRVLASMGLPDPY